MDINGILSDLQAQIDAHVEELKYNPHFFLTTRTNHIVKQTAYFVAQAAKIQAYATAEANLQLVRQRLQHQEEAEEKNFETLMEMADLNLQQTRLLKTLVSAAQELGVDVPTYNLYRLNQLNVTVEVDKARQLAQVDVDKHQMMKEIDDDFDERSTARQLRAALAYQQISIEQAEYIRIKLISMITKLHDLEYSGLPIDLIQAQRPVYQMMLEGLRGKLAGLLQADNRENTSGSNPNPFRPGLPEPDMGTGQE